MYYLCFKFSTFAIHQYSNQEIMVKYTKKCSPESIFKNTDIAIFRSQEGAFHFHGSYSLYACIPQILHHLPSFRGFITFTKFSICFLHLLPFVLFRLTLKIGCSTISKLQVKLIVIIKTISYCLNFCFKSFFFLFNFNPHNKN